MTHRTLLLVLLLAAAAGAQTPLPEDPSPCCGKEKTNSRRST